MKKLVAVFTLAFVLALALLVSCSEEMNSYTGSINIVFNNTAKALEPTISLNTYRYQVVLSGPNGETEELTLSSEATGTSKKDLAIGQWTVTVNALNSAGTIIGTGSTTVEVQANQTATANITVSELAGQGTLTISIGGDNPNNSTYTLKVYKNDNGTDSLVKEQTFALDESNVLKAQVALDNGFYLFKIESSVAKETCPVPEAVRMVKGDSLSASYLIETNATGDVAIVISNTIVQNPSLSLALSAFNLRVGDSVTVTANGLEENNYKYEWYLDKTKIDGETNTLTINNLSIVGKYTVNCIVRDTASSLVWSASKSFNVYDENYKPQTITVNGEVEFYLASDVLMYAGTFFSIKDKQADNYIVNSARHFIYTFTSETEISAELIDNNGHSDFDTYDYYFEERDIDESTRTLIYVVVDKEIENYGYVTANSGDIGAVLDPYKQDYFGKLVADSKYIPYLPYNDSRTLKVEAGTYDINSYGYTRSNLRKGFVYPLYDKDQITVRKDETVEITLQLDYTKISFKNALFEEGSKYRVWLLYNNELGSEASVDSSREVLDLVISASCDYDEVVIWDSNYEKYYRIAKANLEENNEIDVTFTTASYVDSGVTIPSGRVEFELETDTMLPWNVSAIFWKVADASGTTTHATKSTYYIASYECDYSEETKVSYFDILNNGYQISVTTSSEADSKGQYTLVKICISQELEEFGTLVVTYDIAEVDMSTGNKWTAICISAEDIDYSIFVDSSETVSLKVKPGEYSKNGCWTGIDDSSGNRYYPVTEPTEFTITSGQTTNITVKLEQK